MKLSEMELFSGTTEHDCLRMVTCFDAIEREFNSGEIICDFSEKHDCVGIILKGTANIIRLDRNGNQSVLERLNEGSIFGELIAFSSIGDNSIMVICEKTAVITFIDFQNFSKRCGKACSCHSIVVENMFRLVAEKAFSLSERIEILSNRSIRDKLLCYFQMQCSKAESASFLLPFSMTDLADHICVDRSAMMRELKRMKEEELIFADARKITVI